MRSVDTDSLPAQIHPKPIPKSFVTISASKNQTTFHDFCERQTTTTQQRKLKMLQCPHVSRLETHHEPSMKHTDEPNIPTTKHPPERSTNARLGVWWMWHISSKGAAETHQSGAHTANCRIRWACHRNVSPQGDNP